MEDIEYKWLPHLEGAVPVAGQGKRISTYTVALEGWRRGLELKFYSVFENGNKLKVRYSLGLKDKVHHFSLSMGDKVSDEAFEICDDKDLTKQYLTRNNVPVPKGDMFNENDSEEEIINYALSLGFPLVVKPTDGNAGQGVFANIQEVEALRDIVYHVRNDLGFSNIIVEEYVEGEEFRILVIEGRVLGAMNRRPAYVEGDGIHTIRELIHQKNRERRVNPHLTSRLIRIDREIEDLVEESGYELNSIPLNGEVVHLREKSNLSTGGEAEDVTEQLTPILNKIATDVGKAIPGLPHYGVDMIVNNDRSKGVILEVNTRPGLGGHLFPGKGHARDFAKEIIDYYFPETKDGQRTDLYFDFDSVLEPVIRNAAYNVDVISPPLGKLYGRKFTISGDFDASIYRRYIRHQALIGDMHGYTEMTEDNKVVVVVVNPDEVDVIQFKDVCLNTPNGINIANIDEEVWNKPIRLGFETKADHRLTSSEIRYLLNEHSQFQRDVERLNKRYSDIIKSNAWRATYPVRVVLSGIKSAIRSLTGKYEK